MSKKKKISKRSSIDNFLVMEVLSRANEIEKCGKNVIHLELGEPLKMTPKLVIDEAKKYLNIGLPGYTPSNGIQELRESIANFYKKKGFDVQSKNIFITVGSSGAFLLTFLVCFDPGDTVLLFKPCYPAYRNILNSLNINVIEIDYNQMEKIKKFKKINGIIVSSPNNPTGKIFSFSEIEYIHKFCLRHNIRLISDEIYHGIEFQKKSTSINQFGNNGITINSFSKYFCMPGWRLGWAIIPDELCENFMKLSQNLFISTGSIAQKAAVKVFDCLDELNKNVNIYYKNRDIVFNYLNNSPWSNFTKTEGAFYTFIDLTKFTNNSSKLVNKILDETSVALTPGQDFDKQNGSNFIRLSFSCETKILENGMLRLTDWIKKNY